MRNLIAAIRVLGISLWVSQILGIAIIGVGLGTPTLADDITLPMREGVRPEMTNGLPYVQPDGIQTAACMRHWNLSLRKLPFHKVGPLTTFERTAVTNWRGLC